MEVVQEPSPEYGEAASETEPEPITVIVLAEQDPSSDAKTWIKQVHGPDTQIITETGIYLRSLSSPGGLIFAVNDQAKRGPVYLMAYAPTLQAIELGRYTCRLGEIMCYGILFEASAAERPGEERLIGLWHVRGSLMWQVVTKIGRILNDPLF